MLGLGVSSEIIIGAWHGLPFPKPLGAMREAVDIIRRLLRNERVTAEGAFFRVRNLRPNVPVPSDRTIPIYIGALNPGMLRLARRHCRWRDSQLDASRARATRHRSYRRWRPARRAGRSGHRHRLLYPCLCHRRPGVSAGSGCAGNSPAMPLSKPTTPTSPPVALALNSTACRDAWQQGDRAGATQCISDTMVHAMAAIGSAEACRAQLAGFCRCWGDAARRVPVQL